MSKQRRTPIAQTAPATERAAEEGRSPDAQESLGNAALLAGMSGAEESSSVELDPADHALPLVGRAVLALQLIPRDAEQVDRFVTILGGSRLPEDRKSVLIERLQRDQQAAVTIHRALTDAFGRDDAALRETIGGTLDRVWEELQGGHMEDGRFVDAMGATLAELAPGDAVDALIGQLVAKVVDRDLLADEGGARIASVCRSIALALAFDEEEEEEEDGVVPELG